MDEYQIQIRVQPLLCYAKSLESCPTLCDPIDGSLPGSPVPGILQARTLEWVVQPLFTFKKKRKVLSVLQFWQLESSRKLEFSFSLRIVSGFIWTITSEKDSQFQKVGFLSFCLRRLAKTLTPQPFSLISFCGWQLHCRADLFPLCFHASLLREVLTPHSWSQPFHQEGYCVWHLVCFVFYKILLHQSLCLHYFFFLKIPLNHHTAFMSTGKV